MIDYTGFEKDSENEGLVKGWIVFNNDETTFEAIYKTEDEAKRKTEELGKPYAYSYGSHKANTDEFILDSYEV